MNAFTDRLNPNPIPQTRKYLLVRIYVTLSILLTLCYAIFDPVSIHAVSINIARQSMIPVYVGALFCFVSMFDIFVNDILPRDKYCWITFNNRHVIYLGMSITSISMSANIIFSFGHSLVLWGLWLDGLVAAVVASLDLMNRHKAISWNSSINN